MGVTRTHYLMRIVKERERERNSREGKLQQTKFHEKTKEDRIQSTQAGTGL